MRTRKSTSLEIVLLLVTLISPSRLLADNSCEKHFATLGRTYLIDQGLKKSQAAELQQVFSDIDAQFLAQTPGDTVRLMPPQDLTLTLLPVSQSPRFDPLTSSLTAPYRYLHQKLEPERNLTKHPKFARIAAAHEYGHAIFMENMKANPDYQFYYLSPRQESVRLMKESAEFKAQFELLTSKAPYDREAADRLLKLQRQSSAMLRASILKMKEADTILSPYNELFADTVAVLYSSDPQAISKTVLFAGDSTKELKEAARLRDFTARHRLANFPQAVNSPHGLLAPTRAYLWDQHLSHARSFRERAAALKKILNAITSEAIPVLNGTTPASPDSRVLNERLMHALDREFSH